MPSPMPSAVKDSQISLRLPLDMKQRMERYAQLTGRNKSNLVMEAVGDYLAWRVPQIEDLQAAIDAADAGEFAGDAEVNAVLARSSRTATTSSPIACRATKSRCCRFGMSRATGSAAGSTEASRPTVATDA